VDLAQRISAIALWLPDREDDVRRARERRTAAPSVRDIAPTFPLMTDGDDADALASRLLKRPVGLQHRPGSVFTVARQPRELADSVDDQQL